MNSRLILRTRMTTHLVNCCQRLSKSNHFCKWYAISYRYKSSTTSPSTRMKRSDESDDKPVSTPEDRYSGETKFSMPKVMDLKPIQSMSIVNRIEKVIKYEPFIERLFLGEFDKDFLTFPILLKTRQEYIEMSDQFQMIRQLFHKIRKDEQTLDSLAFYKLFQLSVSEMVYIFEAMGSSNQNKLSFGNTTAEDRQRLNPNYDSKYVTIPENQLMVEPIKTNKSIVEELIPLLIHNSMSYYAINSSFNESLKQEILEKRPKIGFAFCEPNDNLGSLPYIQWESRAKLSNDKDYWLINGSKSRIFKDNYDYYLVFCRSEEFPEERELRQQNQYGIVTLLVPKEQLIIEDDGIDSLGIQYQKISFQDLLLLRERHEVIKSEEKAIQAQNVKACGQICSAAIVLGLLKQLLRNTYDFVTNERLGLSECEVIQKILSESTRKVYAIESMLYLTAAAFDSFESGADFTLESLTVKTLATEYAYDVIKNLRSIYGSRFLVSSTAHDLINVFDSFLDCSTNNRMYLALRGLRMQGQWRHDHIRKSRLSPLYPIYALKLFIGAVNKRRDNIPLDLDLCGFVHPNLKPAAEWLEYSVKKLDIGSDDLLRRYGKNIITKQQELYRLSTIAMDLYMMTAVISRASHALCTGLSNSDIDKEVAFALSMDSFLNITRLMDEMMGDSCINNDSRNPMIHNRNLKYDGYFAMPTIDRII